MKISTKGRYGLRAMIDVGKNQSKGPVSIHEISKRQKISESYLEQLVAILKKAELVHGTRGSKGGYVLLKDADQITVGDIFRALEGELTPVKCIELTKEGNCSMTDKCVTKTVWKKINDSINYAVDNIKLSDLIKDSLDVEENEYCK